MNGQLTRVNNRNWQWRCRSKEGKKMLVEISLDQENMVNFIDGPEDQSIRGHYVMGGVQPLQDFITKPYPWIKDYPGLLDAIRHDLEKIQK
jgi:hypothetical protein